MFEILAIGVQRLVAGWSCIQSSVVVELCSKGKGERCQNRRREKDN